MHIVDSPPPFLPFSFVEDISSGTKDRLPDLDDAPSNADATLSFGTAPVVPNADVPIRPYADLMPINRPQLPGTPDANPDQNHRKSSYPLLEKALGGTPNHPLQAGQISPPHANKTSAEILTLKMAIPTQNPPAASATAAPDLPVPDRSEITLNPSFSKTAPKSDHSTLAPPTEEGKVDHNALFHRFHQVQEPDFIGTRIVHERVVHQIANALSRFAIKTDGNVVELILTPKELGTCRFTMVVSGDRVDVDLAVDNPEVLQLMRRQVDLLITELKVAGFNQTSINFSEMKSGDTGFSRSQRDDQATQTNFDPDTEPETPLMETPRPLLSAGRLHLKL